MKNRTLLREQARISDSIIIFFFLRILYPFKNAMPSPPHVLLTTPREHFILSAAGVPMWDAQAGEERFIKIKVVQALLNWTQAIDRWDSHWKTTQEEGRARPPGRSHLLHGESRARWGQGRQWQSLHCQHIKDNPGYNLMWQRLGLPWAPMAHVPL